PLAMREDLRQALHGGERKIDRFTGRFGCASAEWPIAVCDPFFNVNTPDELAEAVRLAPLVDEETSN
ncbi:MAG TPA: molybdenum cofactor guanylyltransferase MobA, partial [Rhabdaerophilum sp.]|nr:molybdenum cofactor guanylyltransferase MobA [Rhabdaerophilum sp.]